MGFLDSLKELFDSGDPTIRSWPVINSYYLPFAMSLMYVLFVTRIGPYIMKNRQPFDLRNIMIVYNFSIVLSYTVAMYVIFSIFFALDMTTSTLLCNVNVVEKDGYTNVMATTAWWLYLLKYIEFADTIFFVLRKKYNLITNLHVVHHAVLPILGWVLFRTEKSGYQFIPGAMNSVVHIIMYTYYGLAAMGPEVQKYLWWKEYLTKLQMIQFVLILLFVLVGLPLMGCKTSKYGVYLDIFFAFLFLGLFYNFYVETYKKPKMKQLSDNLEPNGTSSSHSYQNRESVKKGDSMTEHVKSS